MFMCIYRLPSQNKQYFLDKLLDIIDHYSSIYGNYIILGDFNMEPSGFLLNAFMQSHNLSNLIKPNTCFKRSGSCIDLILKNQKKKFKKHIYICDRPEQSSSTNLFHAQNDFFKKKTQSASI